MIILNKALPPRLIGTNGTAVFPAIVPLVIYLFMGGGRVEGGIIKTDLFFLVKALGTFIL